MNHVVAGKLFYRTYGVQAHGLMIQNITFVTKAESCLHECFIRNDCRSFNAIKDRKERKYTCQLFSNDLCDLDREHGMHVNPLSSAFFSSLVEDCFLITSGGRCAVGKRTDDDKIMVKGFAAIRPFAGCGSFSMRNGIIWKNDMCIGLASNEKIYLMKTSEQSCMKFKLDVTNVIFHEDGIKCIGHYSNYLKRRQYSSSCSTGGYRAVFNQHFKEFYP